MTNPDEKLKKSEGLYTLITLGLCDISYTTEKPKEGLLKRLVSRADETETMVFSIFRNESELNIIFNKTDDKVEVKSTNAILSIGFNSDLLDLVKIMKYN